VILGYKITFKHTSGLAFSSELNYCDGSDSDVISTTSCTIPLATLMGWPYELIVGDSISAKVTAYNVLGDSPESTEGNGAVLFISVEPDAPISLARDYANTDATKITFTWAEAV